MQTDQNKSQTDNAQADDSQLQKINAEIYKHSLELAIVNKTLSLLSKLYQISLLSLEPAKLAEKISETVLVDLNMEMVGVFTFEEQTDSLIPLKYSESKRFQNTREKVGLPISDHRIIGVQNKPVLNQVVYEQKPLLGTDFRSVWGEITNEVVLKILAEESHVKTILLYPLIAGDKTIGILLLGLNRDYGTLNAHEKESIINLSNVVSVALDKALLYEQLKITNEELKALDLARAEFISIASHQLRTPPATVKWYLAAVLSGDYGNLDTEIKQVLEKAFRTNNSLISLIDDMLNVSRIERGKMEFLFEEADIESLVQITFEQLQPIAHEKKLDLLYNPPAEHLPHIMIDKEKLRQVMNNLIDNAIKYTKQGSVLVEMFKDGENVRFQVTDTGKGIAPGEVNTLFQKYTRGKESIKHSAGLGLGLYVAKTVIEQHKGKIWAESPGEGKGSRFVFTIPIHNNLEKTTLLDLTKIQ